MASMNHSCHICRRDIKCGSGESNKISGNTDCSCCMLHGKYFDGAGCLDAYLEIMVLSNRQKQAVSGKHGSKSNAPASE